MTQVTINVENNAILPHLKKILNAIEGVSIAKPLGKNKTNRKKTGIEEAMEDIKAGRINHYNSKEDFYKKFGL